MDEHRGAQLSPLPLVHLMALNIKSSEKALRRYDFEACTVNRNLEWSPSGEAIYVCGTMLQFASGQMSHPVRMDGFVDGQHYLNQQPLPEIPSGPARVRTSFSVGDLNCAATDSWSVEGAWGTHQVEANRQVALIGRLISKRYSWGLTNPPVWTVLDLVTHQPLPVWMSVPGNNPFFLDKGTTLCTAPGKGDRPLQCWDLNSGQEIGTLPQMENESLWDFTFQRHPASSDSSRLLTRHFTQVPVLPIFQDDFPSDWPGKAKVWDIRSGREIASWRPQDQRYTALSGKRVSSTDPIAISPDGHFVAEGGNGIVRLYRLD